MLSSFELFLSPRGDRCEPTSPTVRQLLNHGYRFETLKRRLGFTAVPCQAMANLAVEILAKVWVRTWRNRFFCNTNIVTPHPSRFARHLLPQEKAGKNSCFRQRRYQTHARPAFIAGVQTMRARICSAFSCDMFARVVWLKPRRAAKPPTFALSFAAPRRACHAWLARLTRARGGRYVRGRKALLHDFWYTPSRRRRSEVASPP